MQELTRGQALELWHKKQEQRDSLTYGSHSWAENHMRLYYEQCELEKKYDIFEGQLRNRLYTLFAYCSSFTVEEMEEELKQYFKNYTDIDSVTYTFLDMLTLANNYSNLIGDKKLYELLKSNPLELAKFIKTYRGYESSVVEVLPYDMKHVFEYLCGDSFYIYGRKDRSHYGKDMSIIYSREGRQLCGYQVFK